MPGLCSETANSPVKTSKPAVPATKTPERRLRKHLRPRRDQQLWPLFRSLLGEGARITVGNALEVDWSTAAGGFEMLTYIVGNPPFYGAKTMSVAQRSDVVRIWRGARNAGLLDYVTCWYALCARAMAENPAIEAALVSTNSITQGEQPGILWTASDMRGVCINFAHRTFRWASAAAGAAGVSCVILGFARKDRSVKTIYDYGTVDGEAVALPATTINPYMVDAPFVVLSKRTSPICSEAPHIGIGNKPIDGGFYFFTPTQKATFLEKEPLAAPFFRRWVGADELIDGVERWFLWLRDVSPDAIQRTPLVRARVRAVQQFRRGEIRGANGRQARDAATKLLADTPTRMHVENDPSGDYLVIPRHSSENRRYIPLGWMAHTTLCGDANLMSADANLYDFGILTSLMHMAWMRAVCGRLESRYRYSVGIVYNNFAWPDPTRTQRARIISAAEAILEARKQHSTSTLATLYDPVTMPSNLARTHSTLDRAVDSAYNQPKGFLREADRVAFLFRLHAGLIAPMSVVRRSTRSRPNI